VSITGTGLLVARMTICAPVQAGADVVVVDDPVHLGMMKHQPRVRSSVRTAAWLRGGRPRRGTLVNAVAICGRMAG
jgi:hypothetical protein